MSEQHRMTRARKEAFLAALRRTGVVRRAVDAAGGGWSSFYDLRARDETFRAQWEDAVGAALGDAETALFRRGVEGVVEREQRDAEGNVRARVVKYDTPALLAWLAARDPAYRKRVDLDASVDAKARVETRRAAPDLSGLTEDELRELERLAAKAR